jgi:hypothetical protein
MPALWAMLVHVSPDFTSWNALQSAIMPGCVGVGVGIPLPGGEVVVVVVVVVGADHPSMPVQS